MARRLESLPAGNVAVHVPEFGRVDLIGTDAVKIANGLCTADLKRLSDGESVEAFFTDERGWVKEYVTVTKCEDRLVLTGLIGDAEGLVKHFDRFIFREDAVPKNRSAEFVACLLFDTVHECFADEENGASKKLAVPELSGRGRSCITISGLELEVTPCLQVSSLLGIVAPWLIQSRPADQPALVDALAARGVSWVAEADVFERLRIESLWPRVGAEIVEKVLPQELDRDERAISFTKGCYLGQETVARLDALGQVQKKLRLLKVDLTEEFKESRGLLGSAVDCDGKTVGTVTSVSSAVDGQCYALATIRRAAMNHTGEMLVAGNAARLVS